MKKNGFTLVELLAVISILAMLGVIVVPVINNVLRNNKRKLYDVQIKNIETGAKDYISSRVFDINIPVGFSRGVTLGTLKSFGYVDSNITNPITRRKFSDDMVIVISNTSSGFSFTVCTDDVVCESVDML